MKDKDIAVAPAGEERAAPRPSSAVLPQGNRILGEGSYYVSTN